MAFHPTTRALLQYLAAHRELRDRIAAPPDQTVIYAGRMIAPAWREIEAMRRKMPELAGRPMLHEILSRLPTPDSAFADLGAWLAAIDALNLTQDSFVAWRAVSGILCSNAVGKVTFVIGDEVSRKTKVFAATEVWVLGRNRQLDPQAQELVGYYQDCIRKGRTSLGVSFVPA